MLFTEDRGKQKLAPECETEALDSLLSSVGDVEELRLAVIISWQFLVWAEVGHPSSSQWPTVRGSALGIRHSLCCTPPNASPTVGSGPSGYLGRSLYLEGQEQWCCWQVIA